MDEILKCDHSNESFWAVLSCGTLYYAVQDGSTFSSLEEILKCIHSEESNSEILPCAVQGGIVTLHSKEIYSKVVTNF